MINKIKEIVKNKIALNEISDIHWKVENSKDSSLLFVNSKKLDLKKIESLLKNRKWNVLITNDAKEISFENHYKVEDHFWKELQKYSLDILYPVKKDLKFIAVTGTNGKTSCAHLINYLAEANNIKCASIGTLGFYKYQKKIEDFFLTSPSYIDIRKSIFTHGKDLDCIAVEASSHGLDQDRMYEISFESAIWTNFTQDHLDYHKTMEEYFLAKIKILDKTKKLFIMESQKELLSKLPSDSFNKITKCEKIKIKTDDPFFKINYNLENLSLAYNSLKEVYPDIKLELKDKVEIPGRYQVIKKEENIVIVDSAHTPDALEKIGLEIKRNYPLRSLNILFGCGGDRDRTKRPTMAKVVGDLSKKIYLTSDNPRFEDPMQIIEDALKGVENKDIVVEVDREKALKIAIEELNSKSILLVAGKGHEAYIDKEGIKHPYSDYLFSKKYLEEKL